MVTSIASTQEISLDFGPKWRLSSVTAPVDSPYSFRSSSVRFREQSLQSEK